MHLFYWGKILHFFHCNRQYYISSKAAKNTKIKVTVSQISGELPVSYHL